MINLADDGSDEELQKVLAMSTNEFDCFSAEDFKEGLGKLDDTMIRYVLLRKLYLFLGFFFNFSLLHIGCCLIIIQWTNNWLIQQQKNISKTFEYQNRISWLWLCATLTSERKLKKKETI